MFSSGRTAVRPYDYAVVILTMAIEMSISLILHSLRKNPRRVSTTCNTGMISWVYRAQKSWVDFSAQQFEERVAFSSGRTAVRPYDYVVAILTTATDMFIFLIFHSRREIPNEPRPYGIRE